VIATTTIDTAIPVVNSKYIKPLGVLSYN